MLSGRDAGAAMLGGLAAILCCYVVVSSLLQRKKLSQCWSLIAFFSNFYCSAASHQPKLLASVLQAASPPKAREPWKPRPGDGISSNWLIAELTHRQAHGLKLQYRS